MSQPKTRRIPAPLYAAAGAGELAYQHLRKLPTIVTELGEKAASTTVELREMASVKLRETNTEQLREKAAAKLHEANTAAATLREKAVPADVDLDRLRSQVVRNATSLAVRNAAAVLAGAQAAQERAMTVYGDLVARGERIIGSGVVQAAETVNADMDATEDSMKPAETSEALATKPARTAAVEPAETPTAEPVEAPVVVNDTTEKTTATPAAVADAVEKKPARSPRPRTRAAKPADTPSAKLPKAATRRTRGE